MKTAVPGTKASGVVLGCHQCNSHAAGAQVLCSFPVGTLELDSNVIMCTQVCTLPIEIRGNISHHEANLLICMKIGLNGTSVYTWRLGKPIHEGLLYVA